MKKNAFALLGLAFVLILTGCKGKLSKGYVIEDGMAQPIVQYSNFRMPGYTNAKSKILRFCVYVETDNDTDNDGKADLVKVFAQVPLAAIKGKYKSAVIYDPTPYNVGTVNDFNFKLEEYSDKKFDYDILYKDCEKRTETEEVSTYKHALSENPADWNYVVKATNSTGYVYAQWYDYYLVRGFAVVQASGIGTLGSEGFELCGFDLEAMAHKCVIEWLTGDRVAYSDLKGTNTVKADWSNGKVAMTGCSYGGTLPFEVATLGPKGLETIIPFAGIASWYDYTNSQGSTLFYEGRYIDTLASFNGGGLFLDDYWTVINRDYASWLWQITEDQNDANGNYTEIWERSNYSDDYENIKCSALIVHGLNDFNVTTKQADYMYKAFKKADKTVKLVLHQDGHNILDGLIVDDELWQSKMNKWLCHYLLDVDNGIENMAEVLYQSNEDGLFHKADKWRDFDYKSVTASNPNKHSTVSSEGYDDFFMYYIGMNQASPAPSAIEAAQDYSTRSEFYLDIPEKQSAQYDLDVTEGQTIFGVPEVHFKASVNVSGLAGLSITAVLVDTIDGEQDFPSYMTKSKLHDTLPKKTYDTFDVGGGYGPAEIKNFVKSYTRARAISYGKMDLANPGCGENLSDYKTDTNLEKDKEYEYTFYMLPTVYTLEPGHKLKLVLTTYDPYYASLVDEDNYVDYAYTVNNKTMNVRLPFKN